MNDSKERKYIHVKGARVHNLKNIEVKIPHNQLVVVTGLSGSGKSTLAFDTIFAEGQRRYVESLSAYARQFLGKINKPDVDLITGIAPAIAIEQKVNTRNPRSTVGTSTEIYDYLKLLFARIGRTYSPVSGREVRRYTVADVVNRIASLPERTRILVTAPLKLAEGQGLIEKLTLLVGEGMQRIYTRGETLFIEEMIPRADDYAGRDDLAIVVDRARATSDEETLSRLGDSVENAFRHGDGICEIVVLQEGADRVERFSSRFELDGIAFEQPTEHMFSFNNPVGACPRCEGYGKVIGIDEDLVVPDKTKSIYQDAIACWRGETMKWWKEQLILNAPKFDFPVHRPFYELTRQQRHLLWKGNEHFHGLDEFFKYLESERYKIQYRVMLSRYTGKTVCPDCEGTRLRKEALYVRVGGKNIAELVTMPVEELASFFDGLQLDERDDETARRVLTEIRNRLQYLNEVGLGYLTLDRLSSTLSGGESQRINLATSLGSSLVGSLYILDEPSIGLHQRDNVKLIASLKALRDAGNSVIVVEHDEDMMRQADWIVDVGPRAGVRGGEIVAEGPLSKVMASGGMTADFLCGRRRIEVPAARREGSGQSLFVRGARGNNLKNIDVEFPLGRMICVTGVSGSGKSSLVDATLRRALSCELYRSYERPLEYDRIEGIEHIDKLIVVDQSPIGRTPRSNPATYSNVFGDIRKLFESTPDAQIRGFKAGRFSFNVKGGRCEACKGAGVQTIEMNFLPDVYVKCNVCNGHRYNRETLEVKYKGKNIDDVLNMTVNQAVEFFEAIPSIHMKLKSIQDVGLGYLTLGQPCTTLSGGESQRIKLSTELAKRDTGRTLYILDEPTTGLHFEDVRVLLDVLGKLVDKGNTVIVIEHNLDVIKVADYLIDIGPEGGRDGGRLVAAGTPEQVACVEESYTGQFLKPLLGK